MPTSTTRTSEGYRAGRPAGPARARGFTLLEILIVVVIVGVLTGTVILGFTGADTEQRLKGSAEQLAYTIELARQHALQRNREWGLYVEPETVQFVEFDPEIQTWNERTERPFGDIEVMPNVELRVESEGFGQLADEDQEDLPQVILFSSGEVTPFTLYMEPQWDTLGWTLRSDGISRTAAERMEFR